MLSFAALAGGTGTTQAVWAGNFVDVGGRGSGRGVPSPARTRAPFGLLALSLLACTGPPPEVVIETHVGEQQARREAEATREAVVGLATATRGWWETQTLDPLAAFLPHGADDEGDDALTDTNAGEAKPKAAPEPIVYDPRPAADADALAAQLRALAEGQLDEVGLLTRNLALADPAVWPEIRGTLLAERKHPKREYKQVLGVIGGDVPNRYGHFDLHWKKAHGYDVRVSEDWFEDLLALEPARISKSLRPVYRETLQTVALLHAAAHVARTDPNLVGEVVATLLDAAYIHDGTFRDEVGRAVDSIGDTAIPHLLRESVVADDWKEGSPEERRAAYARYCLDRMDRLHPSRALAAVAHDRRLLADTLLAYAEVRDGEAAPLLLDWVDADAPGVRRAARQAFDAYVTGPAPQVRRKAIRLFNGATSTQRAELSYREHARLAIRERLGKADEALLEPECQLWLAGGIIDAECEGQPERLFDAYLEHLDDRRLARRDAIVTRALSSKDRFEGAAMLDTLLTDGSDPLEPDLVAPFYVEVATEAEAAGERDRAAQLLRKSAMLLADAEPERARALTVDALVLEARADGLDPAGRAMLLGTARDLEPEAPAVAAALSELDTERGQSTDPLRERLAWTVLALAAALGLLTWVGGRLHRPRTAS